MIADITQILKKLHLTKYSGHYDNHFYVITFEDSNEYSKIYTLLDEVAINTEYPVFSQNTQKNTTKIINYFEVEIDTITYNLFLIADFLEDRYYLKIGERPGSVVEADGEI